MQKVDGGKNISRMVGECGEDEAILPPPLLFLITFG